MAREYRNPQLRSGARGRQGGNPRGSKGSRQEGGTAAPARFGRNAGRLRVRTRDGVARSARGSRDSSAPLEDSSAHWHERPAVPADSSAGARAAHRQRRNRIHREDQAVYLQQKNSRDSFAARRQGSAAVFHENWRTLGIGDERRSPAGWRAVEES